MGITLPFDIPFYDGTSVTSLVPSVFPIAVNGHPYKVDLGHDANGFRGSYFHRETIALVRQQADQAATPGEHTINPEGLWRRAQESWRHGAGQTYLDRGGADSERFRSSKGMDVWTRWQLSLLPDTTQKRASVNTNVYGVVAGTRYYLTDGAQLLYTTDLSSFTAVTGLPGANPVSITTDGFNVWTAHTASGVYKTDRGSGASASYATGNVTLVGYVKGRLMAAYTNSIYNITGSGALPTALFTQANTDFTWVGFAEGLSVAYAAGYSGATSIIYRLSVKTDGTGLDVPVVAATLPTGEIVRSIYGYLGYIVIGTDKGVRFASPSSTGDLTIGALLPTSAAVRCFDAQDRFVWFGWENYDNASTGLGRLDLTQFVEVSTPAYASDLMATGQGSVLSVSTFAGRRVFTVQALGVYEESTDKVTSGTLDTGLITYDLPDEKVAIKLDIRYLPKDGSLVASISTDSGSFTSLGGGSTVNTSSIQLTASESRGETFELRIQLDRGTDTTVSPVLTRMTLLANPAANPGTIFVVPIYLNERVLADNGSEYPMDVAGELEYLFSLREAGVVCSYQEGVSAYSVFMMDVQWLPLQLTTDHSAYNGIAVLRMKTTGDS